MSGFVYVDIAVIATLQLIERQGVTSSISIDFCENREETTSNFTTDHHAILNAICVYSHTWHTRIKPHIFLLIFQDMTSQNNKIIFWIFVMLEN